MVAQFSFTSSVATHLWSLTRAEKDFGQLLSKDSMRGKDKVRVPVGVKGKEAEY